MTRQQVDGYRDRHGVSLEEITQAETFDALRTGAALRDVRVGKLKQVEEKLFNEEIMGGSIWVSDLKSVDGQMVTVLKFNAPLIQQWRGLMDDIAREVGDRQTNVKHSGDPDNPIEVVQIYIPENGRQ